MNRAYKRGFMDKLADSGLKNQLLKIKDKTDEFYDRHSILAPTASGLVGYKMLTDPRSISKLTGTEHLFHGTLKSNIPSILENGLLVSKSFDPNTVSHHAGLASRAKGYVFTGKTMKPINQMNMIQQLIKDFGGIDGMRTYMQRASKIQKIMFTIKALLGLHPIKDLETLKIRIPYEDIAHLKPGIDPEWTSTLDDLKKSKAGPVKTFFAKFMARGYGPDHTIAFSNDIPPEYIKGSSKFKHGLLAELKGMPSYIVKHPGRFMAGAGKLGLGAGLLGLTGYNVYRLNKKRKERSLIDKLKDILS